MTSRTSGARAAFAEVQSRNQDLRKIEETITELAQMMQDVRSGVLALLSARALASSHALSLSLSLRNATQQMATLVLEQDESVRMIETQAVQVNTDVEQGLDQTKKAVKSARAARRKRWICFFILLWCVSLAPFPFLLSRLRLLTRAPFFTRERAASSSVRTQPVLALARSTL